MRLTHCNVETLVWLALCFAAWGLLYLADYLLQCLATT